MDDSKLFDMSDEELEAAYNEAVAQQNSPDTQIEEELDDQETVEESDSEQEETNEDDLEEESDVVDSSEENTEETDDEDASEEESDNPDEEEESEEDEDEGSEEESEEDDEEQPAQSYKFRANGKDYEFTSEEIVDQFPKIFGQAMDYTKKMQAIKPWRKTIDAIQSAKLGHDDVNLMIDVLKGNKEAITEVLKRTGVDALDINMEEDSNYVPKDYGLDDKSLDVKDVLQTLSNDKEFEVTKNILDKEWDQQSWEAMTAKPSMIKLLHEDVKTGIYDVIQPIAEKLKVFDQGSKSDLEYYGEAAKRYAQQLSEKEERTAKISEKETKAEERLAKVKAQTEKRNSTKQASAKRKAATPSKTVATNKGVVDYLEASDEDFEEWYKKVQDSY